MSAHCTSVASTSAGLLSLATLRQATGRSPLSHLPSNDVLSAQLCAALHAAIRSYGFDYGTLAKHKAYARGALLYPFKQSLMHVVRLIDAPPSYKDEAIAALELAKQDIIELTRPPQERRSPRRASPLRNAGRSKISSMWAASWQSHAAEALDREPVAAAVRPDSQFEAFLSAATKNTPGKEGVACAAVDW
jgi:hypothetical protein